MGTLVNRWALDIAGPFPASRDGNVFVIAVVEYVSIYALAKPVKRRDAFTMARFLNEVIVMKYGLFRELLSDRASEFTGSTLKHLSTLLQVKPSHPVPYRPCMMGLIERFNRTWNDLVPMCVNEQQQDWGEWLPITTFAYNSPSKRQPRLISVDACMDEWCSPQACS